MKFQKYGVITVESSIFGELAELRAKLAIGHETDWAIALAMVRLGVADECVFLSSGGALSISSNPGRSALLRNESPSRWGISFSAEQIDLFESFTLRALRDGGAEVDHIDFEVEHIDDRISDWTFTLVYPTVFPLISEDELRRRIG